MEAAAVAAALHRRFTASAEGLGQSRLNLSCIATLKATHKKGVFDVLTTRKFLSDLVHQAAGGDKDLGRKIVDLRTAEFAFAFQRRSRRVRTARRDRG